MRGGDEEETRSRGAGRKYDRTRRRGGDCDAWRRTRGGGTPPLPPPPAGWFPMGSRRLPRLQGPAEAESGQSGRTADGQIGLQDAVSEIQAILRGQ